MSSNTIYTIGHSTHPVDRFISLLALHNVTAVVDVRSSPFSRHNPHFNRSELKATLKAAGINYIFLGRELGARSENSEDYEGDRVVYSRLAAREPFRGAIERVRAGSSEHQIALMCAEKEPLDCHRTILVAQALVERGSDVAHILPNGNLEPHEETLRRLLARKTSPMADLFEPESKSSIAEALRIRESQIAYVRRGESV